MQGMGKSKILRIPTIETIAGNVAELYRSTIMLTASLNKVQEYVFQLSMELGKSNDAVKELAAKSFKEVKEPKEQEPAMETDDA